MHLFISAGEPSGDLHGANLIRELKKLDPTIRISGFGGDKMAAAGCQLLYPLCKHSVMGIANVVKQIFTFVRLLDEAENFFRRDRPDLIVVIDYPGFHWKLAKRARSLGIKVVYFVPPQIWAWARWRVRKMRRLIAHVLSALPFEHEWLRRQGVPSTYIGHPYFDELAVQRLDPAFIDSQRNRPGRIVAMLPGSRNQEVTMNVREMLRAARIVQATCPDTRFLIAAFNDHQAGIASEAVARSGVNAEVHVGRTPEIIELSDCCLAVSGSVSLELMYRRKPAIIVYRMKRLALKVAKKLVQIPYMTLVNLLANRELYPEFPTDRDPSAQVAATLLDLLNEPERLRSISEQLATLCDHFAKPGACAAAARFIVEFAGRNASVSNERPG
jgi:lipid-A-disaccharide synthase